jgi:catechol 2,3-dioxygenase-like lactoylglutathione lyase family enzyme
VISAVHCLVYAADAEATRMFFRDVLGWPFVDAGGGWLIFGSGPSEMAAHPTATDGEASRLAGQHHEITLMCDDLEATVAELTGRGAEFTRSIRDDGFGLTISMKVPGAGEMMLYQPKHPLAYTS